MVNFTVFVFFFFFFKNFTYVKKTQQAKCPSYRHKQGSLVTFNLFLFLISTLPASIDPCLMFSFTHIAMITDEVPARCGKILHNLAANIMV